jgi:hypothetical protein
VWLLEFVHVCPSTHDSRSPYSPYIVNCLAPVLGNACAPLGSACKSFTSPPFAADDPLGVLDGPPLSVSTSRVWSKCLSHLAVLAGSSPVGLTPIISCPVEGGRERCRAVGFVWVSGGVRGGMRAERRGEGGSEDGGESERWGEGGSEDGGEGGVRMGEGGGEGGSEGLSGGVPAR